MLSIKPTILIFEDNDGIANLLTLGARKAKFDVLKRASTIEEARELLDRQDLILKAGLAIIDGDLVKYDNYNLHGIEISEKLSILNPNLRLVAHSMSGLQFGQTHEVLEKPVEIPKYIEYLNSLRRV